MSIIYGKYANHSANLICAFLGKPSLPVHHLLRRKFGAEITAEKQILPLFEKGHFQTDKDFFPTLFALLVDIGKYPLGAEKIALLGASKYPVKFLLGKSPLGTHTQQTKEGILIVLYTTQTIRCLTEGTDKRWYFDIARDATKLFHELVHAGHIATGTRHKTHETSFRWESADEEATMREEIAYALSRNHRPSVMYFGKAHEYTPDELLDAACTYGADGTVLELQNLFLTAQCTRQPLPFTPTPEKLPLFTAQAAKVYKTDHDKMLKLKDLSSATFHFLDLRSYHQTCALDHFKKILYFAEHPPAPLSAKEKSQTCTIL